jgi:hypothetical protein
MKAALFFLSALLFPLLSASQDIITKNNGDEIKAKVLEITPNEIKYKRFDYQQGPTIVIPVSDVFMIKYPNGEKQLFKNNNTTSVQSGNTPSGSVAPEGFIALQAGSPIQLELTETISSKTIFEGQTVNFSVKNDLIQNNLLLVRAWEQVTGKVVKAEKARELGKEGQLHIKVEYVTATDGQNIPMSGNIYKDGENRSAESIGIAALIFWPALFMKGKEAEIPAGSVFVAETSQTLLFKIP